METKKVEITMIQAAEGHTLINKDGRTMGKKVYLSANDSVENWSEITDAEADALVEEYKKLLASYSQGSAR